MSAEAHNDHAVDHHHDDHHGDDHDHGSFKTYLLGFFLSVVLTAIPFWLVMTGALPAATTGLIITAFAVVQIVVHMIFFLHMNHKSEGGWNMLALIFTIVVVVIAVAGSVWVMYHLNVNMMPTHDMQTMG
ncbi:MULTISPECIES: cytochrome o ubiquinol oxidase subunit IV [unclassified Brevundimonas]|uniref:cytochrome o ubiquinol oxidase subunit IV n=1 Tax=unclassified Brevundimonas TaxID=2622653 RepID=UPI000CFCF2A4|nr:MULTISPECIES: cytochrome o ubiquinol oxidase subunit IV [unclassified Brevundimonas]PRA35834.1 cytochrome o ubiquinol oxidase subunit IV [Brevundimonas sp. MYb27]PQZ83069.1 cytochrome o ubiquinol oxidase subunit IV [Brevundimonas sp. MYb31]PRB16369.1 cytochrome o ubiquinol oxidase subunit IV [Brevundimonas sp. MYb52]PRB34968.1 cytochrome o ubiquinol oxidase subunit IV [Brevundimonas sp. MYb46]PRB55524.1 cytochrome o ubiquinol oxidase subunit IV [Brevundimonas sp. MYb33]